MSERLNESVSERVSDWVSKWVSESVNESDWPIELLLVSTESVECLVRNWLTDSSLHNLKKKKVWWSLQHLLQHLVNNGKRVRAVLRHLALKLLTKQASNQPSDQATKQASKQPTNSEEVCYSSLSLWLIDFKQVVLPHPTHTHKYPWSHCISYRDIMG